MEQFELGGQYGERQLRESVGPNDDAVDPEDPLLS